MDDLFYLPRLPTSGGSSGRLGPLPFLLFGAVGLIGGGAMYVAADADAHAFRSSASCQAGLVLSAPLDGTCHVESMPITKMYRHFGKFESPDRRTHILLQRANGQIIDAVPAKNESGDVVGQYLRLSTGAATVQYFRHDAILIRTAGGILETEKYPQERVGTWAIIGVGAGIIGIIGAFFSAIVRS